MEVVVTMELKTKGLVEGLFKKQSSYSGVGKVKDSGPRASGLRSQPLFQNRPYSEP